MASQIIFKALGNKTTLRYHVHVRWNILVNDGQQQRIMCASQNERIDMRIFVQNAVDMLFYKIISTRFVELSILYQWYPHGTSFTCDMERRVEFIDFYFV